MKNLAIEMFLKRADERSAIYFREHRHRADHFDFAIMFDGLAIFAVRLADHHHAAHIEPGSSQRGERQQRVIDRAQAKCARPAARAACKWRIRSVINCVRLMGTSAPPAPSTIRAFVRGQSAASEFFADRFALLRAARPDAAKPEAQNCKFRESFCSPEFRPASSRYLGPCPRAFRFESVSSRSRRARRRAAPIRPFCRCLCLFR